MSFLFSAACAKVSDGFSRKPTIKIVRRTLALRVRHRRAQPPHAHRRRTQAPDAQKVEESELGDLLVEVVIARLKEAALPQRHDYATTYSSLRKDNDRFGSRRVISDLKQRGVHDDIIDKTVGATYADTNEVSWRARS